jgi:hypothetical protein
MAWLSIDGVSIELSYANLPASICKPWSANRVPKLESRAPTAPRVLERFVHVRDILAIFFADANAGNDGRSYEDVCQSGNDRSSMKR